jgi:hypothetical protein
MLVACRLAGLYALDAHYAGVIAQAQSGACAPARPLPGKPRVVLRIGLSYTCGQRG